ncbi:MAG: hypothetical protein GY850_17835 [bacterium]|nr:hypothetical protein [bacterium]
MMNMQSQLKTISKSLAALSKQVEKLSQQVAKAQPANKAATAGGPTLLDAVYSAIKRTKKGVTVAQLKQKTNLDARQLNNALYKLTKKGQVYAKSRGLYVKK